MRRVALLQAAGLLTAFVAMPACVASDQAKPAASVQDHSVGSMARGKSLDSVRDLLREAEHGEVVSARLLAIEALAEEAPWLGEEGRREMRRIMEDIYYEGAGLSRAARLAIGATHVCGWEDEPSLMRKLLDKHHGSEALAAATVLGRREPDNLLRAACAIWQDIRFGREHAVYRPGKDVGDMVQSVAFVGMEREFCRLYLRWHDKAMENAKSPSNNDCFGGMVLAWACLIAVGGADEAIGAMIQLRSTELPVDEDFMCYLDYGIRRWLILEQSGRDVRREALLLVARMPVPSSNVLRALETIVHGSDMELARISGQILAKQR
jgi:hypothetical protein